MTSKFSTLKVENKVVDALSRNARLNFTAVIHTYTIDLDEQVKSGIEQDEIYQNLQAKVKENPTESLSKWYRLNEKLFL